MSTTTGGRVARVARFARSVVLLLACVVGVPWALTIAARARFDGPTPWHGVSAPGRWTWGGARRALTEQLTEDTIADVVIRSCLAIAWAAVVVLVVTVVAEVSHMVRHDGLPRPDVRGLWGPQTVARVIAAGLLVVLPALASPSRAIAREGVPLGSVTVESELDVDARTTAGSSDAAAADEAGSRSRVADDRAPGAPVPPDAVTAGTTYVVRAGDSVFGIAERLAGPDPAAVAACAERLLDLNLGRAMPDGRRFTNAAYLDVGWVLDLPPAGASAVVPTAAGPSDTHVVARGETLWSIADDELGDPLRWPEIYAANRGRAFDDGRTLDDPSLIQPGWQLDLPRPSDDDPPAPEPSADPPEPEPAEPTPDAESAADAVVVPEPRSEPAVEVTAPASRGGGAAPTEAEVVDGAAARPSNRWIGVPPAADVPPSVSPTTGTQVGGDGPADSDAEDGGGASEVELLTLGRAAMLSAGALALLAARRRSQLRRARPRARLPEPALTVATTERALRAIEPGDRFLRVDLAVRAAAMALVAAERRVLAVTAADDGALVLHASGPAPLDAPWVPTDDACRHELPAAVPIERLAAPARRVGAPCPTLVQLGRTPDRRDLYVDLEALEALEIGGPGQAADAIVTALAATLASSVLAEVTTLVGVGIADEAFLGHRHHVPARDASTAFTHATAAVGSTGASGRSTFELRARATGGETWEPAVVLFGAAVGTVTPPVDRTGLAVVSASPIHGPCSRLEPDGRAWVLRPLGIRCVPVGLDADELATLAGLIGSADVALAAGPPGPPLEPSPGTSAGTSRRLVDVAPADDLTLAPMTDDSIEPDTAAHDADRRPPPVLVRLLGPVSVRSADGREATFEKSKSKELIAWLATHRERATRSAARTALWELDVRDATFANVVSEARRSLARLVDPPDGEEWVGRTLTEALPLHPLVRTDAELVREALATARVQPPAQAIATLRPAVDLVVGIPFESTGYLWPEAEGIASQLVLLATTAAAELAAHCLSVGDIDGVFDATARGLQVLPGHEELIGLRMRAHATAGDHAGVRLEWEQYERIVHADPWSDGEPSPTLVDLRRRLLPGRR